MSMTDPIADMLTRIRNANRIRRSRVDVPLSRIKVGIAEAMKRSGYIRDFKVLEGDVAERVIRIDLKYGPEGQFVINEIIRSSTPGRRVYRGVTELPKILNGMGVTILSTSKGILNDAEARAQNVGGEVLATIW
jgi:small subunit ribosomal protein S8